jgi:hypothetical protein
MKVPVLVMLSIALGSRLPVTAAAPAHGVAGPCNEADTYSAREVTYLQQYATPQMLTLSRGGTGCTCQQFQTPPSFSFQTQRSARQGCRDSMKMRNLITQQHQTSTWCVSGGYMSPQTPGQSFAWVSTPCMSYLTARSQRSSLVTCTNHWWIVSLLGAACLQLSAKRPTARPASSSRGPGLSPQGFQERAVFGRSSTKPSTSVRGSHARTVSCWPIETGKRQHRNS